MVADSEVGTSTQDKTSSGKPDDIHSYFIDAFNNIPWFTMLVTFILYILSQTDVYNKYVLDNIKGATNEMDKPTQNGILITGLIFAILLSVIVGLHNSEYI